MEENKNNKKVYSYDEVYEATLKYFNGDDLATTVWIKKYCHKFLHDDGTVDYYELTPEDMFHRLAKEYARAGMKYNNPLTEEEIFDLFNHYKYIFPQGRPLTGIGTDDAVSISNCFVVGYPDYDSYGTILAEDEEMTHIFRRGGGCIEEHQEVITNRGIIPIKDVAIGDEVLSFNIKTNEVEVQRVQNKYLADVKLEEQIKITYDNGTVLRTSVKHPVLMKEGEGWKYENQLSGELDGSINYYTEPTDEIVYGEEEPLDNDLHVVYNEGIFTLYRGKAKKEYHRVFNEGNTAVVSIEPDNDGKYVYWDIEVENNFNYFAGNNGFVVIHNCGVDISHYRPKNSKVHNAAMTSSGPVQICAKKYSDTVREVGQCIEEHQNVLTPDGLKEIKDVEVGDKVWTEKGFIEVINKYDNGIKPVYRVHTKFGNQILATDNHTFTTCTLKDGVVEKQLGDFNEGDPILMLEGTQLEDKPYIELDTDIECLKKKVINENNEVEEVKYDTYKDTILPKHLNEKLAYLLGYIDGNGHVEHRNNSITVSLDKKNVGIIEKITNYVKDVFGYEPAVSDNCDGNCVKIGICASIGTRFLVKNGICKEGIDNLHIFDKIFKSSNKVQMAYLAGLFDSDGYAQGKKGGYSITTVNVRLANDLMLLLSSNGITGKIHYEIRKNPNWRPLHKVTVVGENDTRKLLNLCTESVKIQNKNFVSKRNCYLTPYTWKTKGIKKEKYIPDPTQFISTGSLVRTGCKDAMLVQDYFKYIEYEGDKQVYDIELADEHLFWCEGFYVHNSGRRAACLISMDITHPDAEEFIDAKTNSTEITGANISVKIYDDWMKSFVDNPNPNKENERLWKKIIHNAWQWAEPGVLFWDTIIRESVPDCYEKYGFKTLSTNPCQPACAPVLTKDGLSSIGEIKVGDEIWSEKGWVKVINKVSNGLKEAFAYRTTCGTIYSTENHHVLYKGEYVEIKDTKYVDALNGDESDFEVVENKEMVLNGLVLGSGIVQEKTPSHLILYDASSEDDIILEGEEYGEYFGDIHWENDEYGYEVSGHTIAPEEIRNRVRDKFLPERFKHLSKSDTCNFLKGLFSSIGDYDKAKNRIRIEYINEDFANDIALLLYSVGITSRINKDKGDFMIRITLDAERYMKYIGFIQPEKAEKVMKLETPWGGRRLEPALVYGKKSLGEVEVYDITVDSILHTYWSAGHNISNCGEIPLSAKDSCRLMGLNLYSYVVNPFSKDAYFDFDLLKKHSRLIMKLMDNMIDLEVEKVDLIIDKVKSDPEPEEIKGRELKLWQDIKEIALKGRRSGIGFTGEGDMLAALGYKYGTQEATDFAVKVQKTIAENTYIESCLLVQEEGREKFPVFDYELEKDNPFLNRLADGCEEFAKLWRNGKGRRNIANLTCAPVGSLSTQTQTTSGIEPLFMPFYFRKRKIEKAEGIKPDFIDETGDWFEEYFVCHHKYIVWYSVYKGISFDEAKKELTSMKKNEMDEVYKKSPYYQATANDVNWVEKVRMQGGIQKYLDHSISACLLPDTLIETTDGLYYLDELTDFSTLNEGEFRVNDSFEPEAITMNGEKHKITRFYNNGEKDTFLVKLLNGSYVECTSNERLYVLNEETGLYEWKQVSDLKEGEFVKVKH